MAQLTQGRDCEGIIHAIIGLDTGLGHFVEQLYDVPVYPSLDAGSRLA
jgi:hypothetical protein